MTTWNMLALPDSLSINSVYLMMFHDISMVIILFITLTIMLMIISIMMNSLTSRTIMNNNTIEMVWTILPMITLVILAMPSMTLLYMTDEFCHPQLTIKSTGNQWYWTYEYAELGNLSFESYLSQETSLSSFRLLDVDNRIIMPYEFSVRIMITASDVIHSFAVPSMGVKMDATPGRINQVLLLIMFPGLFFGQCSEICGMNHSSMPIALESTSPEQFIKWINTLY